MRFCVTEAASNPGPLDFLGPLEIFSRAAMQSYQEKGLEAWKRQLIDSETVRFARDRIRKGRGRTPS